MEYLKAGVSLVRWEISLFYCHFLCSLSWDSSGAPAEGSHCPEVGRGSRKAPAAGAGGVQGSEVSPRKRDRGIPLAAGEAGSSCGQTLSFESAFRSVAEKPRKRVGGIVVGS